MDRPLALVPFQIGRLRVDHARIGDGQPLLREIAPNDGESKRALAGGGAHDKLLLARGGIHRHADDGVAGDDQRRLAIVERLLRVLRQGQRQHAAHIHRRSGGQGEKQAGHESTVACKLPSEKCATMVSPAAAPLAETTGRPQRLPSGLATMA